MRNLKSNSSSNAPPPEFETHLVAEKELGKYEIDRPTLYHAPKQFQKEMDTETFERTALLTLTTASSRKGHLGIIISEIDCEKPPEEWGKSSIDNLILIFKFLNTMLVANAFDAGGDDLETYVDTRKDIELGSTSFSVLHRCVHAFATGYTIGEEPNDGAKWRNLRATSFAASDMIRNLKFGTSGKFKKFIARQLFANGVPQGLWKILAKFGVAPGIAASKRLKCIEEK